jgi:hypothetical protein
MLAIDHVVLLVPDLPAAESALAAAGLVPGRAGAHPGLGTVNRLLMFERGPYLELLAVAEALPANARYRRLLAEAAGAAVAGLALAVDDPAELAWRLDAAGVPRGEAFEARRPLPDEPGAPPARVARFGLLPIDAAATPGGFAFGCHHATPELVWEPAPAQPAFARGIESLALGWAAALARRLAATADRGAEGLPPAGTRAGPIAVGPGHGLPEGGFVLHLVGGARCAAAGGTAAGFTVAHRLGPSSRSATPVPWGGREKDTT